MKASLQLKIGQSLTMTPQLQQAIRLLQLSTMELETEIQDALDSNMMLELDEDNSQQNNSENENSDSSAQPESNTNEAVDSKDKVAEIHTSETETGLNNDTIPTELPVDSVWEDIYDNSGSFSKNLGNSEYNGFDNQDSESRTLSGHLLWQLNLTPTSDTDKAIATAIIDALDDDGYLTCSLEDILASLGDEHELEVEMDEVEAVLRLVQSMEPTGVAARDLQECLHLQLAQCAAETPWLSEAKELVDKHLHLLGGHDYNRLLKQMKLSREQLQEVVLFIQTLNPRPGNQIQESRIEYIVPDVFVRKEKGAWKVELNAENMPRLRINSAYANMIKRADSSDDNVSLKSHLQEARWFIKSLQSRSETLLRVATSIVERQRAFLDYGEEAMKPLVLHDIAETLNLHESTISRVTTRKYMHTPRGIFELKYFFSSHVGTDLGGTCSSTAIRALIKKLVSAEKLEKPLSDSKIATILADQGINVARRTVAKYRESMAIPPSNERKRLV
ncbi:MAG: RNA polymerase factor sigma-54 [Gammaproteobacteria bacterium]|jgi:RNA polymerase sigma-54 factor|nr:RNA polymerase factor sigma-54 [Gammaproteobacteria bacterium]